MEALKPGSPESRARADSSATPPRPGLRACMVSFYFPPNYSGSAVQAHNLSRHLHAKGVTSSIVSANLSGAAASEVVDGIPIHRVPVLKHPAFRVPSFSLSLAWFLIRYRRSYDVIHVHGGLYHGIASIVGRALGKKTLLKVAMANSDIALPAQGRLVGTLNRFLISRFDGYIATTEAIREEFATQGLDTGRVTLVTNGVDTTQHAPLSPAARDALRRTLGLPPGPLITFVGIVNGRKNVDGILRIWQQVIARGLSGQLAIIGPVPGGDADPFLRTLNGFIDQHGLRSRVAFLGQRSDVSRCLQASDVFLFPSRQEGMPNAVLEAMACGLPCLVTKGTGTDGIITDGVDGFLRSIDDEQGFADELVRVLSDAELSARVGGAARRTIVERFSLEAIAGRYAALYQELVQA
jgi:glycosyltransferase involved in cell wall biosynthesis